MAGVKQLISKLAEYTPERIERDILAIVKKYEADLVDLNIAQMMAGIDSQGSKITPEYSDMTMTLKRYKGQPTDRVTLRDEGDFHQAMFASDSFPISIWSRDYKTDKLVKKYGAQIFNLTPENKKLFVDGILKEEIQAYYKSIFQVQ